MATTSTQFKQTTLASIKSLEIQMSQMAKEIRQTRAQVSRNLPSQTIMNPKACAMTLKSGKHLEEVSHKHEESLT